MDVPVELSRTVIAENSPQQFIFLREKGGERQFPILIGIAEAYAIDRRLKNIPMPRPMTHDLLASVIDAMGGQLEKVVVSDIRQLPGEDGQTFIATLHIRKDGRVIEVDARPSDAVALGVGLDTPLFVADHVFQEVLKKRPTVEIQADMLRGHMEMLAGRIEELTERLSDEQFLAQAPPAVIQKHRRRLHEMQAEYQAIEAVLKKLE